MSVSETVNDIPTCYATVSIGTSSTPLQDKLDAIAYAGWQGIELGFPDLLSYATSLRQEDNVDPYDYETLCSAAAQVKDLCAERKLKIWMLQPFDRFEGWNQYTNMNQKEDAWKRARGWISIMQSAGCDMLPVESSDAIEISDRRHVVADLQALAYMLEQHGFRLAYENWCWSTHAPKWSDVWEIVKAVDRPNVGLCLDTFQTAGSEWADPSTASGLMEHVERPAMQKSWEESLSRLAGEVDPAKIFILQISDAYKHQVRLHEVDSEASRKARATWSMSLRPPPFAGGYLPVVDVARAVLQTGFRGVCSMEVFDGGPQGSDNEWKDVRGYATRAMTSLQHLLREAKN